jgi:Spy/CpxP family protein refolding chaperone
MRTVMLLVTGLLVVPLYPVVGQQRDTTEVRSDSLRQRIEERFASRVQQELGLTNEQTAKLRATSQQFGARHRELRNKHRQLGDALRAQLRPGVAANQDSVAKLTDALIDLRIAAAQLSRDEMRDVSKYLNPLQRARLFTMRERFRHRVEEVREHQEMRGGDDESQRWSRRRPTAREAHE